MDSVDLAHGHQDTMAHTNPGDGLVCGVLWDGLSGGILGRYECYESTDCYDVEGQGHEWKREGVEKIIEGTGDEYAKTKIMSIKT